MTLIELYSEAEAMGIEVDWYPLCRASSLSIMLPDGSCCIAMDPYKFGSISDESVHLAHELGHCATGSFYNPYTELDVRRKHENHADRWAIERLIGREEYVKACERCEDIGMLAESFGVTEGFMKKAVCLYTHGNLAVEEYM